MLLFSSVLFGICASLDSLLIGMACGMRNVRISFRQNLFISLITLVGTGGAITLGIWLIPLFPPFLTQIGGSILLLAMGLYYLLKWVFRKIRPASGNEKRTILPLSLRETFFLGIVLSFNNMGIGISASMAGLKLLPASFFSLLFSLCFLAVGNHLSRTRLLPISDKLSDPLSGLLLIILGICQMFLS